jgi:16S rRNA (guanine527-N7)-methyltransferase
LAAFEVPRAEMEALAGAMTDDQARLLAAYGELVSGRGRQMSLVSRGAAERLSEHLIDSAALLSVMEPGGLEVADLGSGAGLPGVVVSILRPGAKVSLIDSRRNRVGFLKAVRRRLELPNVKVVHARLESLAGLAAFDLAVARALGATERVLLPALRLLAPEGSLVLFKGPRWADEADAASAMAESAGFELGWTRVVELPGVGRSTTFVEFHVKRRDLGSETTTQV